jgi:hypothetical protein
MAAMASIMDITPIRVNITKVIAVITGAITIGGINIITGITIVIPKLNATIATNRGTTNHTGPIGHTIPTMATDCPFLSSIRTSVSDSVPVATDSDQSMSACRHPLG